MKKRLEEIAKRDPEVAEALAELEVTAGPNSAREMISIAQELEKSLRKKDDVIARWHLVGLLARCAGVAEEIAPDLTGPLRRLVRNMK